MVFHVERLMLSNSTPFDTIDRQLVQEAGPLRQRSSPGYHVKLSDVNVH